MPALPTRPPLAYITDNLKAQAGTRTRTRLEFRQFGDRRGMRIYHFLFSLSLIGFYWVGHRVQVFPFYGHPLTFYRQRSKQKAQLVLNIPFSCSLIYCVSWLAILSSQVKKALSTRLTIHSGTLFLPCSLQGPGSWSIKMVAALLTAKQPDT